MTFTFATQLGFAYGILSLLAAGFVSLMIYWKYKKPVNKVTATAIFFRLVNNEYLWYVQFNDGIESGPYKSETEAKGFKSWFNSN